MTRPDSAYATALTALRETLRDPSSLSPDELTFALSSTLQELHLHTTSLPPSKASPDDIKAINRYLPSIQGLLLGNIIPSFLAVLEDEDHGFLLRAFFVPPKIPQGSDVRRAVALVTYLSLPTYLSSSSSAKGKQPSATLTPQANAFILSLLETLPTSYGIDDLYWVVYGSTSPNDNEGESSRSGGWQDLQWEQVVRSVVGLPAKVLNAIGRWKAEGKYSDLLNCLEPK